MNTDVNVNVAIVLSILLWILIFASGVFYE